MLGLFLAPCGFLQGYCGAMHEDRPRRGFETVAPKKSLQIGATARDMVFDAVLTSHSVQIPQQKMSLDLNMLSACIV